MFEFYRLKNGVRVMLVPVEGVKSVAVGVYVGAGSRYETQKINGISHFTEHMVFKGTRKFPTYRETSYLEGLGAIQNAWTSEHHTVFYCKIVGDKWKKALEMVKELALFPVFPVKDLEIERGVVLEEIKRREDRPDQQVGEVLQGMLYRGSPLGMTVLGEPGVIKTLSRDDFLKYHQSQYVSDNVVVVLAGGIKNEMANIKRQIEGWFGGMVQKEAGDFEAVKEVQSKPQAEVLHKEKGNQVHLELAVRGISFYDKRRYALKILTSLLGRGMSSRLFVEIREKRGLCYTISASDIKMKDTGFWTVYAGLNKERLDEAIEAILVEMGKVKQDLVGEKELTEAKEKIRGMIVFAQEDPANHMDYYGEQALERPDDVIDYDTHVERLMGVTAEEVRQVARDLFVTEKLNLAIVGPVQNAERLVELLHV